MSEIYPRLLLSLAALGVLWFNHRSKYQFAAIYVLGQFALLYALADAVDSPHFNRYLFLLIAPLFCLFLALLLWPKKSTSNTFWATPTAFALLQAVFFTISHILGFQRLGWDNLSRWSHLSRPAWQFLAVMPAASALVALWWNWQSKKNYVWVYVTMGLVFLVLGAYATFGLMIAGYRVW